jgi:hypothetical protein
MLTKNFHQLQAVFLRHIKSDCVKQGSYKTGFIGCLAGGVDNPAYIEREYGVPLMVSRLAESIFGESIFERLPTSEAPEFVAALPDAIETDGKDLSTIGWKFLAAELRSLPAVSAETLAVIAGMDRLAQGLGWPAHEAESALNAVRAADADAARAGYWPAYAALAAATYNTTAAAWAAAWAATYSDADIIVPRRRQRDTLLKLIKEAPVTITTQENS